MQIASTPYNVHNFVAGHTRRVSCQNSPGNKTATAKNNSKCTKHRKGEERIVRRMSYCLTRTCTLFAHKKQLSSNYTMCRCMCEVIILPPLPFPIKNLPKNNISKMKMSSFCAKVLRMLQRTQVVRTRLLFDGILCFFFSWIISYVAFFEYLRTNQ